MASSDENPAAKSLTALASMCSSVSTPQLAGIDVSVVGMID